LQAHGIVSLIRINCVHFDGGSRGEWLALNVGLGVCWVVKSRAADADAIRRDYIRVHVIVKYKKGSGNARGAKSEVACESPLLNLLK
jgi:hypothetical protein